MSDTWTKLKEWPELYLDRLDDAGVARITLNRPDKRNCWNRPLCNAFLESLDIIRADKELKIVITRGAGKVYSSGLDLTFLREVSNGPMLDWDRPNLTIQIAEDIRALPAHHDRAGARLLSRRRARHHELPRHRVRGRGLRSSACRRSCAARSASSSPRRCCIPACR